jgi:4-oxalocrotonate tautomerase
MQASHKASFGMTRIMKATFLTQGEPMPTIRVELIEGRTPEQKKQLAQALTQACEKTLGSKPESVDVLFFDIPRHDWATGGVPWSEKL